MDRLLKTSIFIGILVSLLLWACAATRASESKSPTTEQDEAQLFETAYDLHMKGQLEEAIYYYKRSIETKPTAKAHTFLGWSLSHQGKYDEAIAECLKAIELDPDYGNPYNDIGAYYIEKDMYDEAIPYLEKAIEAKNCDYYQLAHFNLGRVYVKKERYLKALDEFKKVLEIDPNNLPARIYLELLHQIMSET